MAAIAGRSASLPFHEEAICDVPARPASVFEHVDQPQRLSAHMARSSWRMAGTSMVIETDAAGGRTVGSRIRLNGRMLGIRLHVECEVVRHKPPRLKAWQTIGEPR